MSLEPAVIRAGQELPHQEWRQPLIRYLITLGLSGDDAQDVAQEAFLRLHQHVQAGGEAANLKGWLFRVAHNEARNRQSSYERRYGGPMDGVDAAGSDDPEGRLLDRERSARLAAAVRTLGETERECLRLRAQGMRYREIGQALGLPVSTVADTIERTVKKLAEKI